LLQDETTFIAPLLRRVDAGRSLADEALESLGDEPAASGDLHGQTKLVDHYYYAGARHSRS
jgi:hypothetical protein